jgi:hypothetical protein
MSFMSGVPLNPQSIIPVDINISTLTYVSNIIPPYQNVSSGTYNIFINSQSDLNLLSFDRGTFRNIGYFNYSTVADTLIGSSNAQFILQNKNDFSYFPLVTRISPFNSTCEYIAYNGSIFLAVGSGVNTIATSVDGISWVPRGNPLGSSTIFSVIWNGSLWLAGGNPTGGIPSANLLTSPDGITWTLISYNFYNVLSGVQSKGAWGFANNLPTFGNTFSLAVFGGTSSGSTYYTTSNGTIWTQRSGPAYFWAVAWNGAHFIATNISTNIYRSTDGLNWTVYTIFASGVQTYGIVWASSLALWACAAFNSTGSPVVLLATSSDGISWTTRGAAFNAFTGFYDIAWNGTNFLALGNGPAVISSNGTTWTNAITTSSTIWAVNWNGTVWVAGGQVAAVSMYYNTSATVAVAWTNSTNVFTTRCYDIKYNGSILVAVGTGTNCIAYSSNGTSWTGIPLSTTVFTTGAYGVLWAAELGLWIAMGDGSTNRVMTSPNGINWTGRDIPPTISSAIYGVGFSPLLNQWATVGDITNSTFSIATTRDFINWTNTGSIFTTAGWCVLWSSVHNLWIAGGQGTNTLATSIDGIGWTPRTSPITSAVYDIAFNGSLYVAVGTGTNVFATSPDGIVWTGRGSSGITSIGRAVDWSPSLSLWVAVGSGTNSIATSPDGTTWSGITTTSIFSSSGLGIVWSAALSQFIAGGQGGNTLATSRDGVNWLGTTTLQAIMTSVFCIAWNGTLWVAGGTAGSFSIASSTDGIIWTGRSGLLATTLGVAWSGSLWVAVGTISSGSVATSTDGISWTNRGSTFSGVAGRGVIWYPYNSFWIAVVASSTIWTSPDGVTWTSRTSQYSTQGSCLAFFRNIVVAGGTGTNCIVTSSNGINWTARSSSATSVLSLAYSPTLSRWVAGGTSNSIGFSDNNAITWTFSTNTQLPTNITGLIWNGTYFVATGTGNIVLATSADGITWRNSVPVSNAVNNYNCITYKPPIMVAGGQGTNVICISRDNGITWTQSPSAAAILTITYAVAWNGNIWVAVGGIGIITSPDGVTWTNRGSIFGTAGFDVLWADGLRLWIAVGTGATGTNAIVTSPDGVNWTSRVTVQTVSFSTGGYRIGWSGNLLVVTGNGTASSVAISTNGTTWRFLGLPITASASGFGGVVWNGQLWAAVSDAATNIWTSLDGITWTSRATLTAGNCRSIAWNGTQFLVLGNSTWCSTSPDGFTWTMRNTQPVTTLVRATWNSVSTQWVVASTAPAIFTTPDAVNWIQRQAPVISNTTVQSFAWAPQLNLWALVGGPSNNVATASDADGVWVSRLTTQIGTANCVAWNGSLFVAGGGTSVQIYTSTDGVTWTSRTNGGVSWTVVNGVAWSSNLSIWVAVGANSTTSGVIASSTDGASWTSRSTTIFGANGAGLGVAVNTLGTLFVAVGTSVSTFAYSSNGTSWLQGTAGTSITTAARGVVWANQISLWVAVGNGTNSIATSSDGISWTGRTGLTIFGTQGNQVATNGNVIVATGVATNAWAYSYDGSNWFGQGFTLFPTSAIGVAWNSTTGQWLMGSGTNSNPFYASSPDGLNWTPRQTFGTAVFGIGYPLQREKNFTITNSNWTGRSTQQNFRIVSV